MKEAGSRLPEKWGIMHNLAEAPKVRHGMQYKCLHFQLYDSWML
jgi:hypothetical protein